MKPATPFRIRFTLFFAMLGLIAFPAFAGFDAGAVPDRSSAAQLTYASTISSSSPITDPDVGGWADEIAEGKLTLKFERFSHTGDREFAWWMADQEKPVVCLGREDAMALAGDRLLSPAIVTPHPSGAGALLLIHNAEDTYGELWWTMSHRVYCLWAILYEVSAT